MMHSLVSRIARFSTKAKVPRGEYGRISNEDVAFFKDLLSPSGVINEPSDLSTYTVDWLNQCKGEGSIALRPHTTEQVSKILKYCNDRKLAVVPQGGNTGLVGGGVPVHDEVVISTSLMKSIESFDEDAGIVVCQPGCVLQELDSWLGERGGDDSPGFMMPLDLGAKGSCQIGGNASTNAGGIRFLRYGSLRSNIMGVEAVLADGTVLDCMSGVRKDNTGIDLKQLFLGSEGTLGVITRLAVLTPPRPSSVNVAFFGLRSFADVRAAANQARRQLGEVLSALELVDRASMASVLQHQPNNPLPLSEEFPFYLLIETHGSNGEHDEEKMGAYLEDMMEKEVVQDGVLASDLGRQQQLWELREGIASALSSQGYVYKYDVSLPGDAYYQLVEDVRERLAHVPQATVTGYGHLGDSNLHLNVLVEGGKEEGGAVEEVYDLLHPYVYEYTASVGGSISAEHGVGLNKKAYLPLNKPPPALHLMRQLKSIMDPGNILNPYKVFPDEA